ncbi:hypothetical protein NFI96_000613 [Prochilodus magdalenae]|nr:hypothetical protein NFI96_000613 [Prochilodus magdalenae]
MDPRILRTFYTCTVDSILIGSITTWYGSCTAIERKALQRAVRTAQYITGVQLPNLLDLYTSRCLRKTRKILKDSTHPSHCLFSQLPSGRRFRIKLTRQIGGAALDNQELQVSRAVGYHDDRVHHALFILMQFPPLRVLPVAAAERSALNNARPCSSTMLFATSLFKHVSVKNMRLQSMSLLCEQGERGKKDKVEGEREEKDKVEGEREEKDKVEGEREEKDKVEGEREEKDKVEGERETTKTWKERGEDEVLSDSKFLSDMLQSKTVDYAKAVELIEALKETLVQYRTEVRRTLRRINPRKSAGPDNIPGRVLRECADQISKVLADIFNVSFTQAAVPTCLKTATIIPVPKSSTVTGLNDYRPIALTQIVTKCFERLVMTHIKATIDVTVDLHQYAYRRNRSTDDAISSVVHTALTHLEQKDSYVRMLFVDFTSAFNTMIPQTLTDKLYSLGLRSSLCNWVLDFLTS